MLDKSQRTIVEAIKQQRALVIEFPTGQRVKVLGKKVVHDIALSVQDYYNRGNNEW